jgi:hypothetical protein
VFVGVEQQDPVVRGQVDGVLLLRAITGEGPHDHARAMALRNLAGGIGGTRIQHDAFFAERHAGQARLQRRGVVEGRDHRGKRRARLHADVGAGAASASRASRLPAYNAASIKVSPPQNVE